MNEREMKVVKEEIDRVWKCKFELQREVSMPAAAKEKHGHVTIAKALLLSTAVTHL